MAEQIVGGNEYATSIVLEGNPSEASCSSKWVLQPSDQIMWWMHEVI
jgi:hypothetical protein